MRIASHGQASTQSPQTTQRSSSILKTIGNFSICVSEVSPASMWMHLAGQAVEHMKQATQRGLPSSRGTRRCMPRKRCGYTAFTSGYWTVAVYFCPWTGGS
jgi:hypothetical protein